MEGVYRRQRERERGGGGVKCRMCLFKIQGKKKGYHRGILKFDYKAKSTFLSLDGRSSMQDFVNPLNIIFLCKEFHCKSLEKVTSIYKYVQDFREAQSF